jgi:outer membrane protein OmpA-like peptidoglycan-associated protein
MRTIRRLAVACFLAAIPGWAQVPAPEAGREPEPSVESMIEALRAKPLTRSLQGARAGTPAPRKEGRLQLQVHFEYASARITPDSRALLEKLAQAMKTPALEGLEYRIEGHTDSTGSGPANLQLSQRRAEAVRDFLARASGVDPARLSPLGMGSARPADPAHPEAGVNRRVVVVSLEPLPAAPRPPAAAAQAREGAGVVEQVRGEVQVRRGPSSVVVSPGTRVKEGDVLTTGVGSAAMVRLDDGAKLLMRAESVLRIVKLQLAGDTSKWSQAFNLVVGAFRYVTGALGGNRPDAVGFSTAWATVGIRGTDIDVVHAEQDAGATEAGTYVKVNQGAVTLGGADGTQLRLAKDEQAFAGARKPRMRGGAPVPAAVKLAEPAAVFQSGDFDALLENR